ncbi:ABC transporter permease subunit [bacterium]|nr:ABC transporter permease subunit [bacterium]
MKAMLFGRRWLLVILALAFAWTVTKLGTNIVNLSESADPWSATSRFFSAALSPSLADENPNLPEGATPFLERVGHDLLRTFRYAIIAMSMAVPIGLIFGLFASELVLPANRLRPVFNALRWGLRMFLSLVRAIHELIWAIFFLAAVGDSPITACLALGLPAAGILGKVYSELIDEQTRSAQQVIRASGGGSAQGFLGGILPAALPDMISYTLYRFECSIRASAVLGFIGIETIGLGIGRSFENLYYGEVWTQLYILIGLVIVVEALGNLIRKRLREGRPRTRQPADLTEISLRNSRPKDLLVRSLGLAGLLGIITAWSLGDPLLKPPIFEGQRGERFSRFFAQLTPHPIAPEMPVPSWEEREEAWDAGSSELLPWVTDLWDAPGKEALVNTIAMSIAAIILAGAGALLLLPWAIRTLASVRPLGLEMRGGKIRLLFGFIVRGIFILTRAIPEYLLAFLLVGLLGPSAWPLVIALAIHNFGILGRLWGEAAENQTSSQPHQLLTLGGSRLQAFLGAILPMSQNRFILFFFYRWESCVREATVLGMLGISSLGYYISLRQAFLRYDQILFFALLGAAAVIAGDILSDVLRKKLRT